MQKKSSSLSNLHRYDKRIHKNLVIDISQKDLEKSVETRDAETSKGTRTVKGFNLNRSGWVTNSVELSVNQNSVSQKGFVSVQRQNLKKGNNFLQSQVRLFQADQFPSQISFHLNQNQNQIKSMFEQKHTIFQQFLSGQRKFSGFEDKQSKLQLSNLNNSRYFQNQRQFVASQKENLQQKQIFQMVNQQNSTFLPEDLSQGYFEKSQDDLQKQSQETQEDLSLSRYWIFRLFEAKCFDQEIQQVPQILSVLYEKVRQNCINERLDLGDLILGQESAKVIYEFLSLQEAQFVQINLRKNNLGDEGVQKIVRGLFLQENLVHLDLGNNNCQGVGLEELFNFLEKSFTLVSLNVGNQEGYNRNRLGQVQLKKLQKALEKNTSLLFLNLRNCSIGNRGVQILKRGLQGNCILSFLDLSLNMIDKEGSIFLKEIIFQTQIQELNLAENSLGNVGVENVAKGLELCKLPTIVKLDLSNNRIQSQGVAEFFKISKRNSNVQVLNLDGNDFSDNERFETEAHNFLKKNGTLKILSLRKCQINSQSVKALAKGLRENRFLSEIYLMGNFIQNEGAKYLAEIFEDQDEFCTETKIQVLDLKRCQIRDEGGVKIAEAINKNKTLQKIDLRYNMLEDQTGNTFLQSLKTNNSIRELKLDKNLIQVTILNQIQNIIEFHLYRIKKQFIPEIIEKKNELQLQTKIFNKTEIDNKKNQIIEKQENIQKEISIKEKQLEDEIQNQEKLYENTRKELEKTKIYTNQQIQILNQQENKIHDEMHLYIEQNNIIQDNINQMNKEINYFQQELKKVKENQLQKKQLQNQQTTLFKIKLQEQIKKTQDTVVQYETFLKSVNELKNKINNFSLDEDNLVQSESKISLENNLTQRNSVSKILSTDQNNQKFQINSLLETESIQETLKEEQSQSKLNKSKAKKKKNKTKKQ